MEIVSIILWAVTVLGDVIFRAFEGVVPNRKFADQGRGVRTTVEKITH